MEDQVAGPRGKTRSHRDLHPAHQVLRIGADEYADVTHLQIDIEATQPWWVYSSTAELRSDWAEVRDWDTNVVIPPGG